MDILMSDIREPQIFATDEQLRLIREEANRKRIDAGKLSKDKFGVRLDELTKGGAKGLIRILRDMPMRG